MAKYLGTDGKKHNINLLSYEWEVMGEEEDYITVYTPKESAEDLFKYEEDLLDENIPFFWLEIKFHYKEDDVMGFNPICDSLQYTIGFRTVAVEVSKKEFSYFSKMLTEAIGDKHTPEMQKVISNYEYSVDLEIYNFVRDVLEGRDVTPITVGFVSEKMAEEVFALTRVLTVGNRIVLSADDVRHIIKRHGANGKADSSMEDIKDIARLSYVLANYDLIEWDGGVSNLYKTSNGEKAPQISIKKRIDGTYYVVQVASDSSKKRNVITTAYLTKATE